jgi:hypothetical protein
MDISEENFREALSFEQPPPASRAASEGVPVRIPEFSMKLRNDEAAGHPLIAECNRRVA